MMGDWAMEDADGDREIRYSLGVLPGSEFSLRFWGHCELEG